MRPLNDDILTAINELRNFNYCFEILLESGEKIHLTSGDKPVEVNNLIYSPKSGLNIKEGFFNDSAQDYVNLEGIFEDNGINKHLDLTASRIKILIFFDNDFYHLITYYCTLYTKYDLHFTILLEPESTKYNQTVVDVFSQTCRANFGDTKCKIDKVLYSKAYDMTITGVRSVEIKEMKEEGGYYLGGDLQIFNSNFSSKILSSNGNTLNIDRVIPDYLKNYPKVLLTTGCDKKFITCCNKFNNTVNFRGEPFIPEYNFLKINQ